MFPCDEKACRHSLRDEGPESSAGVPVRSPDHHDTKLTKTGTPTYNSLPLHVLPSLIAPVAPSHGRA